MCKLQGNGPKRAPSPPRMDCASVAQSSYASSEALSPAIDSPGLRPPGRKTPGHNREFEAALFAPIVLYYHFGRDIFPKILSALKPGSFLVCKSSLPWNPDGGFAPAGNRPLRGMNSCRYFQRFGRCIVRNGLCATGVLWNM